MNPLQHLQALSSLKGYAESYWLDESGTFFTLSDKGDAGPGIREMMEGMFLTRENLNRQKILKRIDQIVVYCRSKAVIHQFMGRPGKRVLLTLVVRPDTKLAQIKIKLYGIAESLR